jgi:hypothetical protein
LTRPRAIRRLSAALRSLACIAAAIGIFGAGTNADSTNWSQLFLATFHGVPDGPGNGSTFPADTGKIAFTLPSGRLPTDVAPKTGIYSERLVVSDLGGPGDADFGVDYTLTGDAKSGAWYSFDLREETDCTAFGGDVSDGATVDMLCFNVSSNSVTVNNQTLKTTLNAGTNYHVDITVFSNTGFGDIWAFCLTNVDAGTQEWVWGAIDGGYRPVHAASLRKHAGKNGSFSVDNISLLGYSH